MRCGRPRQRAVGGPEGRGKVPRHLGRTRGKRLGMGSAPMIIVQHLRTVWTKASRGAPGAKLRAAVPLAGPIRLEQPAPWVFQSVYFLEKSGFAPEDDHQFTRETHRERDRGLLLELLDDGLHV